MTGAAPSVSTLGGEGTRSLTADAIARLVGGEVVGDGGVEIGRVAPLDRAGPGELTMLASGRYASLLSSSRVTAVLVSPELAETPGAVPCRIVVRGPHDAMLRVLPELYPDPPAPTGIHPTAVVERGSILGPGVSIGAYSVVGRGASLAEGVAVGAHCSVGEGVRIGERSRLFDSVTAYPGSELGKRVRVHAGVRLGSDGFGYVFRDGRHDKIPHVGRCIVEDDVEIGANSTIDRGSIDDTVIGAGTKIDNLVHVAHNVRIGRLCLIMAQVGIAGSVHVEDGVILAGQVGVSGHTTIGAGARLGAQAGVISDVPAGESWSGYPARPHKEAMRAHAALFRLPAILKQLERLVSKGGSS